jgi:hypothetical protein
VCVCVCVCVCLHAWESTHVLECFLFATMPSGPMAQQAPLTFHGSTFSSILGSRGGGRALSDTRMTVVIVQAALLAVPALVEAGEAI